MGELERYGLLALLALTVLAVGFLLEEVRSLQGPEGVFELRADRVASALEDSGRGEEVVTPATPGGGEARGPQRTEARTEVASEFDFFESPVPLAGLERSYPEPPAQGGEEAPSGTKRVQIQPNDTLGKIASRELDASHRWREILRLNDGLDPERLQTGDWLLVPVERRAVASLSTAPSSEQRTHLVANGDNFESIAHQYYADRSAWMRIYEANRDVCRSPEKLRAGIRIVIP